MNEKEKQESFQMPKDFESFLDEKDKRDPGFDAQKKRLEKQLNDRKTYVYLLEKKEKSLKNYIKSPTPENKKELEIAKGEVDLFNLKIEIVAQKHIFVDTYVYYSEDFMKRYKQGGGTKKSVFIKK